ncbi:MAG: M10 family metallopeptidase C-terminal domain-containing protein [Pseudomonadota bacterium]
MAVGPLNDRQLQKRIDAVLEVGRTSGDPFIQNGSNDPPLKLTFRFENSKTNDFPWDDVSSISRLSKAEQDVVRDALKVYERVINVKFVEDKSGGDADISFFSADNMGSSAGGRARWRVNESWDGFVVFRDAPGIVTDASRFDFVLHEIGHALGLKHPGDYDIGGNNPPGPFLDAREDNLKYTLMSYIDHPDDYADPTSLMIYDIAALQERWGANKDRAKGDNTYENSDIRKVEVVWDGGGKDTLRYDGRQDAVIDLREGAFSSLGIKDNFAIAYGTRIERGTGDSGNDTIRGNDAKNVLKGAGGNDHLIGRDNDDRLEGGAGNDTLEGGRGDDRLEGGGGNDDLIGDKGRDRLEGGGGNDTLIGNEGKDRLIGGTGRDRLKGGDGEDQFIFTTAKDSSAKRADADVIKGFSNGDRINVDRIDADTTRGGNQDFDFIRKRDFTGDAGEMRFSFRKGDTIVEVDRDGDRSVDFAIVIDDRVALKESDFLL